MELRRVFVLIKKFIVSRILGPVLDWIANEEWEKIIAFLVLIIFIIGIFVFGLFYLFIINKSEGISLFGMQFGSKTAKYPEIIDLKPISGEIIKNDYPFIEAKYQNESEYIMQLVINGVDITRYVDHISDNRLECHCRWGVIPQNYEVKLSFLDENGQERAAQTARFKTVLYDDFTAGNINWINVQNWIFRDNYLEGTSSNGKPSSIEFMHYVRGDIGIQFDAMIMPGYTGGIGVFFNSFYEVVIGDNNDSMLRIYKDKKLLESSRLKNPLVTNAIYSIKIERRTQASNIQNSSQEAVIGVYIDDRLVATAVDPTPLGDNYPILGLRVWNSKVQIHNFMVYCPE